MDEYEVVPPTAKPEEVVVNDGLPDTDHGTEEMDTSDPPAPDPEPEPEKEPEVESKTPGESGMIHAEINALLKMDYNNPKSKKLYVTLSPCRMCAKAIVNAGISEVIYSKFYPHGKNAIRILNQAGIIVKKTM